MRGRRLLGELVYCKFYANIRPYPMLSLTHSKFVRLAYCMTTYTLTASRTAALRADHYRQRLIRQSLSLHISRSYPQVPAPLGRMRSSARDLCDHEERALSYSSGILAGTIPYDGMLLK